MNMLNTTEKKGENINIPNLFSIFLVINLLTGAADGFIAPFYYFIIICGILGAIEHITIQLIIPEMRSNL
ncbi:MAG: hypothetical protein ABFC98_05345 [Candidatus Cloacimonas sp.]